MLKKRIAKITFVMACLISLIMPYTSPVLAATLTKDDTKTNLQVVSMHKGGEESSGTLTDEQKDYYDTNPYGYRIGTTKIYKIRVKDDAEFSDNFYCVNAKKPFPGVTNPGQSYLEYINVADFKDATDSDVKALHLNAEMSEDSIEWTKNYKALVWLADNMFLATQTPEQKDDYLSKVFKDNEEYTLDEIKAILTDDDIDVVQQFAVWHFTNGEEEPYNTTELPAVTLEKIDPLHNTIIEGSYADFTETQNLRQELTDYLYQYLITNAEIAESTDVTYPAFAEIDENEVATPLNKDGYLIVGPFKVISGTAAPSSYTIKLLDQTKKELEREDYEIYIEGEEDFSDKNVDEIFDKQYYIYIPDTNKTITSVTLKFSYSIYKTEVSLWESNEKGEDGLGKYQPVILINREETPYDPEVTKLINRDTADLALRKYIIKVNDENVNRAPIVSVEELKKGTSTTAEYKHAKDPVKVYAGDTVIYEIRIYNEAEIDATGVVVIDTLPKGLELAENSSINEVYGWKKISEGKNVDVYSTDYLKETTIEGFDKENDDELNSAYVQIECKIASNAKASSVLTNVAEIAADSIEDKDSTPSNNDYTQKDYDSSNYTGDNDNKEDLADKDYYYHGREDDDDFEKVEIEGKVFDLSLKKFVSKVNEEKPNPNREPEVDVKNLKNGTDTNATYKTVKTPVLVEKGDIITYTLRVYNEGELSGYAEEVADYLPEGLGFLVNHNTNVDNYWSIPDNCKTIKLSTIENGTKNLSKNDFTDVTNLSDVDVVVGKAKLVSTKLKSSISSTKNLIEGFDKENDTILNYKDINITCIVLSDKVQNNNLKNVAEITKELDEKREEIIDIDSTPASVNPDDYPSDDKNQDDNDYEDLTMEEPKVFDLSLRKFISKLNNDTVTGREPKASINSDGKVQFSKDTTPLKVENGNIIIYTIRVFNEGTLSGYAKEVADNLPKGLEYLKDNEINKKFGWKLYDKNGNETTDLNQAVQVKTDYLSKEKSEARNENCLLDAFDGKTLYYKDVQIAFKVDSSKVTGTTDRTIKNVAEIIDDEDKDGNSVEDVDSTPNNNRDGEDDIDNEKIYVKYFDLSLQKNLIKIIITENGTTREIPVSSTDGLQKVEINRKKINSTTVKFVYNITVKNEGEIAGYATEIKDYIPEGLEFMPKESPHWTEVSKNVITTNSLSNTLLKPGESASVQVTLKWVNGDNNFGVKVNTAEISADKNDSNSPDIDSTPNNKVPNEDDIDTAEVVLGITTGSAPTYIGLSTTVLMILTTGVILIKKYVLE